MPDNLFEKILEFKLPIALSILGLVLIIGGVVSSGLNRDPSTGSGQGFPKESIVQAQKSISVDVSGAVNTPGVYKLNDGDRIEEAIKLAGGFSKEANSEYISKNLNLAQKLIDGTKIYIPFEGSTPPSGSADYGQVSGAAIVIGKININTASQSELEALSGVGPVTASKIISARPYSTVEELISKKAVGKAVYEKIKDSVVVY